VKGPRSGKDVDMALQINTTYGAGVEHSAPLDDLIAKESAKLEHLFDRILSCRVLIDKPHRHHLTGAPVHVRLDLALPGEELVINHPSEARYIAPPDEGARPEKVSEDDSHRDTQGAVRDAFRKARRRLRDYAERRAGR
jgi:hypothetical protein